jgi:hypothetical protein
MMQGENQGGGGGAGPALPSGTGRGSSTSCALQPHPGRGEPAGSRQQVTAGNSASDLQAKLQAVNARLEQLGASEEFCRDYFHSGAGVCEEEFGGVCVEHRSSHFALPPGLMCARKYGRKIQYLRKRMEIVEIERKTLKDQWQEFKSKHEMVENMLSNNEEGQLMVRERRACLQTQISHKHGELRKLQGEMYRLLSGVKPVDASRFHEEVVTCLLTKTALLEELIFGPGGARGGGKGAPAPPSGR